MALVRNTVHALVATSFAVSLTACAGASNKERAAAIGVAVGAGAGAVVGNNTGSTVRGAIIGAAIGGAAGAVIGHQMDQQAKKLDQNIPGAVVQRVGEGIQVTFESGLLYDFDSAVLKPAAQQNLRNLAASLKEYPNTDVVIVGHTDAQGTYEYNQSLSERRARAAAAYLVTQGVAAARIKASGLGETEPVAVNESDAGRQQNRRVEVAIFANETGKAQARRMAGQ